MRTPGPAPKSLLVALFALVLIAACSPGAAPVAPATTAPVTAAAPVASPTAAASGVVPKVAPTAAVASPPTLASSPAPASFPWWNDRVFYEIFVRSFQDSNGDGNGDLKGLISRLDYLNDGDPKTSSDLGVTGVWLMPIMPAGTYHGYDVTDYKAINPDYGTMEDFKLFLNEAHKRGIKVLIDLVLNHTSSKHPWFIEAQDPKSPKHDWYVWSDSAPNPNYWHKADNGLYYYGYFGANMPDLNYNNPQVTEAVYDIVRFWLEDVKVDGFRLDAIKFLFEDGRKLQHVPATFEWLAKFNQFYKSINPQAFTVGEVWDDTGTVAKYVPGKLDVAFEFTMAEAMIQSALRGESINVARAQTLVNETYPPGQFAPFLANHDQNRTRSRMIEEPQAFTAASMELLYPGVPFIYYGEEIGMQGTKPDENIRRPMQWTADGGFTTEKPWNAYYDDVKTRNVAAQDRDPASLLNHYRSLVALRNAYPALRTGDWRLVTVPESAPSVYSFMRSEGDDRFLVLINLGNKAVSDYQLSLEAKPGAASPAAPANAEIVFGPKDAAANVPPLPADGFQGYKPIPTLPPYSTFVIRYAR